MMTNPPLTDLLATLASFPTAAAYLAAPDRVREAFHAAEDALIRLAAADDATASSIVPALIAGLRHLAWGMRAGAVFCLAEIRDPRAVQPLIEAFAFNDPDDPVAWQAELARALHSIGTISVRPAIYALTHQPDPAARRGAACTLGLFRDPLAVPALVTALDDEDALVRAAAAATLGVCRDARAVQPLIDALTGDADPAVREAAAQSLTETGTALPTPTIAEALRAALDDADWGTRQSAAGGLLTLNADADGRAAGLLSADLLGAEAEVRLGAAASLLPFRPAAVVDPLARLLHHENAVLAAHAARLLGQAGDQRVIPLLDALRTHPDDAVRHAIDAALKRLHG